MMTLAYTVPVNAFPPSRCLRDMATAFCQRLILLCSTADPANLSSIGRGSLKEDFESALLWRSTLP